MKLSLLLKYEAYESTSTANDIEIVRVVSDTRALCRGCLFVCLRGTRLDTHTLLALVEESGAAAVVAECGALIPTGISLPIFYVRDTRATLSRVNAVFYGEPQKALTLIGITGTNGKTSTATILYHILREAGIKAGLIGTAECLYDGRIYTLPETENGERLRTMTTPDPDILFPLLLTMKEAGITHVVMEVSSHALVLQKVVPLHFSIGIFTNLSPEHMDFHPTMADYLHAKASLFENTDIAIVNCDDEYGERLAASLSCRVRRAGVVLQGDYRATDIELHGSSGIAYTYLAPAIRLRIRTPLPGETSVYNTLLALVAATELGVSPISAANTLRTQAAITGRLERLPLGNADFSVFIDYAHTETALRKLLKTVSSFRQAHERIVLLFGCGGNRDKKKRPKMGYIAGEFADEVILTSDNPRSEDPATIIKDILAGMETKEHLRVIPDRRLAIFEAIKTAQKGDIILLVGKGHETYEITAKGVLPFDERKIVKEALESLNCGDTENEN